MVKRTLEEMLTKDEMETKKQKTEERGKKCLCYGKHTFCEPSFFRHYELELNGSSFYVNPHFLGEVSPYFKSLCVAGLRGGNRRATLEDEEVESEDFLEMLQVIHPDPETDCQSISIFSTVSMLGMAKKFDVDSLRLKVFRFILEDFPSELCRFEEAMQLLRACETYSAPSDVLRVVGARLAGFGHRLLQQQLIGDDIQDRHLYAAIMKAAPFPKDHRRHKDLVHGFEFDDSYFSVDGKCEHCDDNDVKEIIDCDFCSAMACALHSDDICEERVSWYESKVNVALVWNPEQTKPLPNKLY